MALSASRSTVDVFSLSLWAVACCAAVADTAGSEGLAYSLPVALLGHVAIEMRSQKLVTTNIQLTALTLLLDIIFLAQFGPSRGGAAMTFSSLAFLAKLLALVYGRKFLTEDLGGVLGLADPAPFVPSGEAGDDGLRVGGGDGGGGGGSSSSMPTVALDGGGGGGGAMSSYQSGATSQYQAAL